MAVVFQDFTPDAPAFPFWFRQALAGPHENFHYLFGDPVSREAAVVDPAFRFDDLWALAEADGYRIRTAFFTHGHADHIGGLPGILDRGVERVCIHAAAADHPRVRTAREHGTQILLLEDGQAVSVGAVPVKAWHTPGHQPEATCFEVGAEGVRPLLTGDTLFIDSCGRTDFPGGDTDAMFESLGRLRDLGDDRAVFPGHHYADRPHAPLVDLIQSNPALATTDRAAFGALPFLRGRADPSGPVQNRTEAW